MRTRCQRTAKSKGQTEEKATAATSSSSHQPSLRLLCFIDYFFFGSFTLVFDRTDLAQTFGSWPGSNDGSAISFPDFFQSYWLLLELEYRVCVTCFFILATINFVVEQQQQ